MIQIEVGPMWDTFDFLSNALVFAGQGTGYADLNRPPFLPFLTSLFFRLGYVSPTVIFALDGAIFVFGVIGFYFLLKTRFGDLESLLGALIFTTFPVVLSFAGSGLTDVPSLSFSIWAIYFTVLAVKKNSKFFYLAFPLLMLAFLTRYVQAFTIFPMLIYILINKKLLKNIKDILIGILLSVLIMIPILLFFYSTFCNPFYSFLSFSGVSKSGSPTSFISPENFYYNSNLFYFLIKMPIYMGIEGVALILIIVLGTVIHIWAKLKEGEFINRKRFLSTLKSEKDKKLELILSLIILIFFISTFGKIYYMFSEFLFFALVFLFYGLLKRLDMKNMDIHFLFFSWFMTFFIFHSVYLIKDDRYFLTMVPAISYFLILGLSEISSRLTYKIKNGNIKFNFFVIFLVVIMLFSTLNCLSNFQKNNYEIKSSDDQINAASVWLINYDSNYKNKTIYSDFCSASGWYLKTHVGMMPIFKDNQTFYCCLKDPNFSLRDNMVLNNYLMENKIDYYFSVRKGLNLVGYKPLKQFGDVTIYERVD